MSGTTIHGGWLLTDDGVFILGAALLATVAVTCALAAVRGRGHSAGARAALGLVALAALALAFVLTSVKASGFLPALLGVALPYGLAAGAVGWAVRLARHGD
ncbi:hypothetical protein ACFVVL_00625 [Kitasatospora sp. NPDC058115]|uniref:hypothetical protein n=1 Tax=Kitasatospora sp. NPDC058115 TaxID=3346347 RepID=UPI0036D90F79